MKFTDENMEKLKDVMGVVFAPRPVCFDCAHKDVCKNADENPETCEAHKRDLDYTCYNSINEMFQPIFDWMKYHYPAGGITFHVEQGKAQMNIEHRVTVFDKMFCNLSSTVFPFHADTTGGKSE